MGVLNSNFPLTGKTKKPLRNSLLSLSRNRDDPINLEYCCSRILQYALLCGLAREITRNSSLFCSFKYAMIVFRVIKDIEFRFALPSISSHEKASICMLVLCQNES